MAAETTRIENKNIAATVLKLLQLKISELYKIF